MLIQLIDTMMLPSLVWSNRADVPDISAVYFVMKGDEVLYVGSTNSMRQRWKWDLHHKLEKFEQAGADRITWYACPEEDIRYFEDNMIRHLGPALNRPSLYPDLPNGIDTLMCTVHLPLPLADAYRKLAQEHRRHLSGQLLEALEDWMIFYERRATNSA